MVLVAVSSTARIWATIQWEENTPPNFADSIMAVKTYFILLAFIPVLSTFEHLLACLCMPTVPPHIQFDNSDIVFSGVVEAISLEGYVLGVTFSVSESWKGITEEQVTVYTAWGSSACGYHFEEDSCYLVYAYYYDPQALPFPFQCESCLFTSKCTRTRLISDASTDLLYLNYLESGIGYPDTRLYQNYPNPLNPNLKPYSIIYYSTPIKGRVTLIVYDLSGREVVRLVDCYMEEGYHEARWRGRDQSEIGLPSGIYIARLVTPEYTESIKMVLLK